MASVLSIFNNKRTNQVESKSTLVSKLIPAPIAPAVQPPAPPSRKIVEAQKTVFPPAPPMVKEYQKTVIGPPQPKNIEAQKKVFIQSDSNPFSKNMGKVLDVKENVYSQGETKPKEDMGLFKKISGGLKKLGTFTGKVLSGVANGGVLGGVVAAATNLGPGSPKKTEMVQKAQVATFKAVDTYKNSLASGGDKPTEKSNTNWIIGGVIAFVLLIIGILTSKKRR